MTVLLLAALLHRSPALVGQVYDAGGIDAVAIVEMESQFNPRAFRYERDREGRVIGTSWGLGQLFDRYHPQYRHDLTAHIGEVVRFIGECRAGVRAWVKVPRWPQFLGDPGPVLCGEFALIVSMYNSGSPIRSLGWGMRVERLRDKIMGGGR